jgi:putative transposase
VSWKVVTPVEERKRFIGLLEEQGGSGVAGLCREFGISRKTAYKWIGRYNEEGDDGLFDRSRAAHHQPNRLRAEMEQLIIGARVAHPSWGAKKLLPWLKARNRQRQDWPCLATISAVLERNQMVRRRTRKRLVEGFSSELAAANCPNELWCIDHKGWWLARNGDKCEPFTVSDRASRFLVRCVLEKGKRFEDVRAVLSSAFHEYGLPQRIRSDNGPPFASRAPLGMSQLSVWLMRLGIELERIVPGKPQQNGSHERIHLTMLQERTGPKGASLAAEQKRLNHWREEYNFDRPHEALSFRTPAEVYCCSSQSMPRRLPQICYPSAMQVRTISPSGEISWHGRLLFMTEVLGNQPIGLAATCEDGIWDVWFCTNHLGSFDERRWRMNWVDPDHMSRRG